MKTDDEWVEVVDHEFLALLERGRELIHAETKESIEEWFKLDAAKIAAENKKDIIGTRMNKRLFIIEKYLTDGIDTQNHKNLIHELLELTETMNDTDLISFLQDELQLMVINGIQNLVSRLKEKLEKDINGYLG